MANQISMEDFNMTMATQRKVLFTNPEFLSALMSFWTSFEAVFGEADWPATICNLQDDAKYLIEPGYTFLEPGVEDESNNWHNRGSLLASYRRLKRQINLKQFSIVEIRPCCKATIAPDESQKPDGEI